MKDKFTLVWSFTDTFYYGDITDCSTDQIERAIWVLFNTLGAKEIRILKEKNDPKNKP